MGELKVVLCESKSFMVPVGIGIRCESLLL